MAYKMTNILAQVVYCSHRPSRVLMYTLTNSVSYSCTSMTNSSLPQIHVGRILIMANQGQSQRFRDTWRVGGMWWHDRDVIWRVYDMWWRDGYVYGMYVI